MIHAVLKNDGKEPMHRRLPFYLAMEEWVACSLPPSEYFFTWMPGPSVICGRNQDIPLEANLDYCQSNGIEVFRRKSGGGCVYADYGTLMVSYITPSTDVDSAFARYTELVADALRKIGVNALPTGRNDIEVGGRKVSGSAFYRKTNASIAHGTMLVSTDIERMEQAITPSKAKLESHKVTSVSARVANLTDYLPGLTPQALSQQLVAILCDSQVIIPASAIPEIEEIERTYY